MEKDKKRDLRESKQALLDASKLYGLFYFAEANVNEIWSILRKWPEAAKNKDILDIFDKTLDCLNNGKNETCLMLKDAQTEYISTLENVAEEEELFFVDTFGSLSFPEEE